MLIFTKYERLIMHLVTGSSGYVGSVIVNKLLESNKEVIAIR